MSSYQRLYLSVGLMLASVLYGTLVAIDSGVASAIAAGYAAFALTAIILPNCWRKEMTDNDEPQADPVKEEVAQMPKGQVDRRKHGYAALEKKMDGQFVGFRNRLNIAFLVAAVTIVFGLVSSFVLWNNQRGITDDIQDQRFDSLVKLCEGQNERHDLTIREINRSNTPEESKQFRRLLVDRLQPKVVDCTADAKKRVRGR